jgi:hypothetical protein
LTDCDVGAGWNVRVNGTGEDVDLVLELAAGVVVATVQGRHQVIELPWRQVVEWYLSRHDAGDR